MSPVSRTAPIAETPVAPLAQEVRRTRIVVTHYGGPEALRVLQEPWSSIGAAFLLLGCVS